MPSANPLSRGKSSSRRTLGRRACLPVSELLEARTLMTAYYVSAAGNDKNAGTSTSTPWATTAAVNAFESTKHFKPGDQILFQGGQSFYGGIYFNASDSGTASSPVTVSSYGIGRATLTTNTKYSAGLGATNVSYFSVKNINFLGDYVASHFTGFANPDPYIGIQFSVYGATATQQQGIVIDNVDVSRFGSYGISFENRNADSGSGQRVGYSNVRITNSASHDNADNGINFTGNTYTGATGYSFANVYIGNCQSYNNTGLLANTADPSDPLNYNSSGNGIILNDVDGATIERCISHDNGWRTNSQGGGPAGIWSFDANNVVIQYCEAYHNQTGGASDGGGFDIDGGDTNCVIQYCYSHDNQGTGLLIAQYGYTFAARPNSNNTLRYNISQNDATKGNQHRQGSILVWSDAGNPNDPGNSSSDVTNDSIYGNTVYSKVSTPLETDGVDTTNLSVFNNIFYAANGQDVANLRASGPGFMLRDNDYFSTAANPTLRFGPDGSSVAYTSLNAFRVGTGQEISSIGNTGYSVDPKLVAVGTGATLGNAALLGLPTTLPAYTLQPTSPLIDAGVDPQADLGINAGPHDFFGNALLQRTAFDVGADELPPVVIPPGTLTGTVFSDTNSNGKLDTGERFDRRARIYRRQQQWRIRSNRNQRHHQCLRRLYPDQPCPRDLPRA